MPFIESAKRPLVRAHPAAFSHDPGDRCFLVYSEIMRLWKAEPRWKTVDQLYANFVQDPEDNQFLDELYSQMPATGWNDLIRAAHLAFNVFWDLHAIPYEVKKRLANGDI